MFLRYNRCIWKMPCAPLHCKQQQEAKSPGETATAGHRVVPCLEERQSPRTQRATHHPLHT